MLDKVLYVKSINAKHDIPEKLWKNAEKFTDLAYEIRSGYRITDVYKDYERDEGKDDICPHMLAFDIKDDPNYDSDTSMKYIRKQKIILRHPESVLDHSARVANTISEIILAYPRLFEEYNHFAIMKVALGHDIGEATVHDIPDDGSIAHDLKKVEESKAVLEYYSSIPEPLRSLVLDYHYQSEDLTSFLGQMLRMVDKTDAIARLIMFEKYGIKGNIYDKNPPSEQDVRFAKEIGTGNCTDVWARHLHWTFFEKNRFDPAITQISEDFLYKGTTSVGRPWFSFWPRNL